jgi:hypothetical protein
MSAPEDTTFSPLQDELAKAEAENNFKPAISPELEKEGPSCIEHKHMPIDTLAPVSPH